jgi:hypothetical protein
MKGATDWRKLATKQDFANNLKAFPKEGLEAYQAIYNSRHNWLPVMDEVDQESTDPITQEVVNVKVLVPRKVNSIEDGINDETRKVIMSGSEENPEFLQLEWQVDLNSIFYLKGFTDPEVEAILGI